MVDFLDNKGDRWVIRDCESDHAGCTVIERFTHLPKDVQDGHPPAQTIDVPPEILDELIGALEDVRRLRLTDEELREWSREDLKGF
jgi:hypothetical protein